MGLERRFRWVVLASWLLALLVAPATWAEGASPEPAAEAASVDAAAEIGTRGKHQPKKKPLRANAKLQALKIKKGGKDYYTIKGRPRFQARAGKTTSGAHDLRHIVHYSTGIRRPYEAAANRYLERNGKRAFMNRMIDLFEANDLLAGSRSDAARTLVKYKTDKGEPSDAEISEVMEHSVATLNSTPGNLFSGTWTENQGSDQTRQRAAAALEVIDDPKIDFKDALTRAEQAFSDPKPSTSSGKVRTSDGDSLAEVKAEQLEVARVLIRSCPDKACLAETLEDVSLSTALDLPKTADQREVNRFALEHVGRMRQVVEGSYGGDELEAVFRLNQIGRPSPASAAASSKPPPFKVPPPPPGAPPPP